MDIRNILKPVYDFTKGISQAQDESVGNMVQRLGELNHPVIAEPENTARTIAESLVSAFSHLAEEPAKRVAADRNPTNLDFWFSGVCYSFSVWGFRALMQAFTVAHKASFQYIHEFLPKIALFADTLAQKLQEAKPQFVNLKPGLTEVWNNFADHISTIVKHAKSLGFAIKQYGCTEANAQHQA